MVIHGGMWLCLHEMQVTSLHLVLMPLGFLDSTFLENFYMTWIPLCNVRYYNKTNVWALVNLDNLYLYSH